MGRVCTDNDMSVGIGLFRFNFIADPGIGFAKNGAQNLELLERQPDWSWPSMLGASRKRFLGNLVGKVPDERDWATAAAVSASVVAQYNIVRVHNVMVAVDVCRVADAIWKRRSGPHQSELSSYSTYSHRCESPLPIQPLSK